MKYHITSNKNLMFDLLRNSFIENYQIFLNDQIEHCFKATVERSEFASIVMSDKDLVSFSFHRYIKYDGTPIDYLSGVNELFLKSIQNKMTLFTVEFMTVDAKFRGKFTKHQPADIIVGLVLKLMQNSPCDAVIGFSRQDNQTDKLSFRMGTRSMGTVDRFNLPCSVIFCENNSVKPHPISQVQNKIDELWQNRVIETTSTQRNAA